MVYICVGSLLALVCAGECWAWGVLSGVGMDEGDFFGGNGCGEEMLFLGAAVPEAGAKDLDDIAVHRPVISVAAFELEGAGGDADDIAVEVDHGAVGEGVDIDGAVAELGFVFAFAGLKVDGAASGGAATECETDEYKECFHVL
jgi:hypothetical protein